MKQWDSLLRTYERLMEMSGSYNTRDRPRRDPRSTGVALLNTAGQGRGDQGRGARGNCAGRRDRGKYGNQEEKNKNEEEIDKQEGEFSNVNNEG